MENCAASQAASNSGMQPSVQLRREPPSKLPRATCKRHRNVPVETELLKNLNEFRLSGEFCDIELKVEGRTFHCHRNVLAASSNYFRILVGNNSFRERSQPAIELFDIKASTFSKLLDFIYGGSLSVEDDLIDLLSASSYLQIHQAEEILDSIIRNDTDVEDILKVMMWPGLKLKSDLYQDMRETVCTHFERICRTDTFLKLPFAMLREILLSADLLVTDADHLVDGILAWICHDVEARFGDIVAAFQLISSHFQPPACFADLLNGVRHSQHQHECLRMILTGALASKDTCHQHESSPMPFAYVPTYLYTVNNEVSLLRIRSVKKLPVAMNSFDRIEAALLNEHIYLTLPPPPQPRPPGLLVADERGSASLPPRLSPPPGSGCPFYRCRIDTYAWEALPASRGLCDDLVAFNGTLYSFQQPGRSRHQFYSYSDHLSRWLALPPCNVVREQAGITCDARVLYAVGGRPVNGYAPSEFEIQMYDSRCKEWMNIVPTNKGMTLSLFYANLNKRVVYFEGCLYVLQENTFDVLEMRSRRWLNDRLLSSYPSKPRFAFPGKAHLLLIDTNQKFYYYSTTSRMWRKRNANNMLDDVSPLKPVFIPRF